MNFRQESTLPRLLNVHLQSLLQEMFLFDDSEFGT